MLVSETRIARVGGRISNAKAQREWLCVLLEYRLNTTEGFPDFIVQNGDNS